MGEVTAAAQLVGQVVTDARSRGDRLALIDALRVQALAAIRQERWDDATQVLEEGISLAHALPYPYAEGRLLQVYGDMYIQKGEADPARERLEAALAIFRRLGAHKDVERTEQALAGLVQP
jgi:hypothetical protein